MHNASDMCHGLRTYSVESSDLEYLKSFLRTELLEKLDSKIQLRQSGTVSPEAYVNLSHDEEMHCPIDWFVLTAKSVYNYLKSDNEYFVGFKPSLVKIRNPSLASQFLEVQLTFMNSLHTWLSLGDIFDHTINC